MLYREDTKEVNERVSAGEIGAGTVFTPNLNHLDFKLLPVNSSPLTWFYRRSHRFFRQPFPLVPWD